MKISIGSKIIEGPWGGGNLFVINLKNYLISNGASHTVIDTMASGSPTVFSGFQASVATGSPCGHLASRRMVINIY